MAGDWIKVTHGLHSKPEVYAIARHLGISNDEAVGLLIRFWCWVDLNSVDGCVDHMLSTDVDRVVDRDEFGSSLVLVKWIVISPSGKGFSVVKFDRHNGESAKKRSLKTAAQARWRKASGDVDGVESTPRSTVDLPEKRREEKSKPTISNKGVAAGEKKSPAADLVATFLDELAGGSNG